MILKKIFIISFYTWRDIIKSKVLYLTVLVGFLTVLMTYVATEFTYGVPEKVAIDFGLGMLSITSLSISLFLGASLLSTEIESRTLYMVLSRPIPRWVFITGKILGLVLVLFMNLVILSAMTLVTSYLLGGKLTEVTVIATLFNFLESILLLLLVVLFSLFSNRILSVVISLVLLLGGHVIRDAQSTLFVENRPFLKVALEFYHLVLPGFYKLNFKDFVIYSNSIEFHVILASFCYGTLYSLFLLFLILHIFNGKNLD